MRSQRQLRVGEEVRHALAAVFMRGDVPWPQGTSVPMITVTEVQVSPDLRNASVFIMPQLGDKSDATVRLLNGMSGFFRHALAQSVRLRYVPRLVFRADGSFDYAENIEKILHHSDVAKDLVHDADDDVGIDSDSGGGADRDPD